MSDKKLEKALGHIQVAKRLLREADAQGHPANMAAREHLAAATDEAENFQKKGRPHVLEDGKRTIEELAGEVGHLLSSLVIQLNETKRKVMQFLAVRDPSEMLAQESLENVLTALGLLRRKASGTESEMRLLKHRLKEEQRRSN